MEGDIKNVIKYWMEGEINNFIKIWISVYISLCYCYLSAKIIPKGIARFFIFLPVVCLFLYLPLNLHTANLGGSTSFLIAWLANFKILLFAFNKGPLSDPSLSLPLFVALGCLPIEFQPRKPKKNGERASKNGEKSLSHYAKKALLMALIVKVCDYSEHIHPQIIMVIYGFIVYFSLDLMLALNAILARSLLGSELEPQFHDPFHSTSLQDFWGRRWNLMVTRILRPSVYVPVHGLSIKIIGRKWAPLPGIMATFIVSGIMHELIFYYMGRVMPTWEITWFFLLHGVSLIVEVVAKKVLRGKFDHIPRFVISILIVVYVMVTGFWLFFPQILRCKGDVRAFKEYAAVGEFLKDLGKALRNSTR